MSKSCIELNCTTGCCNYYGICPDNTSRSNLANACWFYYNRQSNCSNSPCSSTNSSTFDPIGLAIFLSIFGVLIIAIIVGFFFWVYHRCKKRKQDQIPPGATSDAVTAQQTRDECSSSEQSGQFANGSPIPGYRKVTFSGIQTKKLSMNLEEQGNSAKQNESIISDKQQKSGSQIQQKKSQRNTESVPASRTTIERIIIKKTDHNAE